MRNTLDKGLNSVDQSCISQTDGPDLSMAPAWKPKLWTCPLEELKRLRDEAGDTDEDRDNYLGVGLAFLVEPFRQERIDYGNMVLRTLFERLPLDMSSIEYAKRKKRKKTDPPLSDHTVEEILNMPEVLSDSQPACYLNIQRIDDNKRKKFTFRVTTEDTTVFDKMLVLPDGIGNRDTEGVSITQPSLHFEDRIGEPFDWEKMATDLANYFESFIYIQDRGIYPILALLSMSTYFREAFAHYPYVGFHAAEVACGKSTAMAIFVLSCYYGSVQTTPSAAVIYREVNDAQSVLGIDELDNVLAKNKEVSGALLSILNSGHTKGIPAKRCAPNSHEVESYDAFGTKVFSYVRGIPESISSRLIKVVMIRAPKDADLQQFHGAYVFREYRDEMYRARLEFIELVRQTAKEVYAERPLINRPLDLFLPILTMARLVNEKTYGNVLAWAKSYTRERKQDTEDDWNRILVETLIQEFYGTESASKDIRESWIRNLQRLEHLAEFQKPPSPRSCFSRLNSLGFKRTEKRTDGNSYFLISKKRLIDLATNQYDIEMNLEQIAMTEGGIV